MDTIVSLFGFPALVLAVIVTARIIGRIDGGRAAQPRLKSTRSGASTPEGGFDDLDRMTTLANQPIVDPAFRWLPGNVWHDADADR